MIYSRVTSNYLKKKTLSDPSHMMSIVDPIVIHDEILWIDSRCSLEKEFIELIRMNHSMIIVHNF